MPERVLIAPSMLSADFLCLEQDVAWVNAEADLFHLDIMDGTFVPNISFGFPVVEAIARAARKPLDAHLMIVHPERYVERFAAAGVRMLSFHQEAVGADTPAVIDRIHACGMQAGVAINPDIPTEVLHPCLDSADYVLIMSVFAGFGGQKFIAATYDRIRAVRAAIGEREVAIEVDGGVGPDNAAALVAAGADILVAGSALFHASDRSAALAAMREPRGLTGCN